MKWFVCLFAGLLMLAGCSFGSGHKGSTSAQTDRSTNGKNSKVIVTPESMLIGKVVRVNEGARFAVLNFPVGSMPGNLQRLNVYRRGLKVGEVRVTGPQQDDNTVADIVSGEAQIGDELRPN